MSTSVVSYKDQILSLPEDQRFRMIRHWLDSEPIKFASEMRQKFPILEMPEGVVVAAHADVVDVLNHPDVFTVALYGQKMGDFMLAQDDNSKHRRDKAVMQTMTPREDVGSLRSSIGGWSREALIKGGNEIEIVRNLTRGVPVRLVQEYFGFRHPDEDTLLRWSYWAQFDNFHNHYFHELPNADQVHKSANEAKEQMKVYLLEFVKKRSQELASGQKADDVLSRMLLTKFPESVGFGLPQIILNMIGLLVGAVETTSHAVTHIINELLNRPEALSEARSIALSEDFAQFDGYAWEALRFAPMSTYSFRQAASDYTVASGTARETKIKSGTTVFALTQSAMFDETVVENSYEFIPTRMLRDTFHLGYGLHRCVGEYIGGAMICEIVRQVLRHGLPKRASGSAGQIDYLTGPFPEKLVVQFD